jgi:phospholipase/carboxylesterase
MKLQGDAMALVWFEYSQMPQANCLMLLLHGRGTTGEDLKPLAETLYLPTVRFILPTAPLALGPDAYQWYDFATADQDIPRSVALIQELVRELQVSYGPVPVLIGGFSQGAVMALAAGLTLEPRPLALVALSGYLHQLPTQPTGNPPAIFIAHGENDPVIPASAGRKAAQTLQKAGLTVTYEEFPIGHGISMDVAAAVHEFLCGVLGVETVGED